MKSIMVTAEDARNATAIASCFGIEPTEAFFQGYAVAARNFRWRVIEGARVGWRVREGEPFRDILVQLAKGPHEAAKLLLADRRRELPFWHANALFDVLEEVRFINPYIGSFDITSEVAADITGAHQWLSDQARALLSKTAGTSGRPPDMALNEFIEHLVEIAAAAGADLSPPARLVDGVGTALSLAVFDVRDHLDDLSADTRALAVKRLDSYYAMTEAAIALRVTEVAARIARRSCQERATQETRSVA